MKVYSDHLTTRDIFDALNVTGLSARGVQFDYERVEAGVKAVRGRKRHHTFTFYLIAEPGYGRRWANSGNSGARSGFYKAATWHEWGALLGELFHRDPDAVANEYDGARDFEAKAVRPWINPPDEARTVENWRTMFHRERERAA